jgi:urease accessory protein
MANESLSASSAVFAANRARGLVRLNVNAVDDRTRRASLQESGSLRVRFPSPEGEGLSAVLINTAGGIAGGDCFEIDISAGEGSRLTLTTAAAEKVYRAQNARSQLDITLTAASHAHLAWLPQETILFDRARLSRRLQVELADTSSLVLCEIVVFGRAAMGERMRHGEFIDRWRVRRGGKLVFAETVRLGGDLDATLAKAAVARGANAIGTALIVPGDDALVERVREIAEDLCGEVGISAWNGFAMARFCAQDAAHLRADMMKVLTRASPVPLPRLWLN